MKHIIATTVIVTLLIQTLEGFDQCSSSDFVVKNNGNDYLVISSPTEVKTCGGINICDAITEGKQSLSLNDGQLSISAANSVQLPDKSDTNEIQSLSLQNGQLTLSNSNAVLLPDVSDQNEIQNLALQNGQLSISNGNTVTLPDVSDTNEIQNLSIQSGQLIISGNGGNSVTLPDADPTNEIQSLSLQNGALKLSKDSATVDTKSLKTFLAFSVRIPPDTVNTPTAWNTAPFSEVAWITFPASSYNKVTKSFTPPYTGYYRFNLRGFTTTVSSSSDKYFFHWNVNDNGVFYGHCGGYIGSYGTSISNCNYIIPLNATDTVTVRLFSTIAITLGSSSDPPGVQFEWQGEYMGPL